MACLVLIPRWILGNHWYLGFYRMLTLLKIPLRIHCPVIDASWGSSKNTFSISYFTAYELNFRNFPRKLILVHFLSSNSVGLKPTVLHMLGKNSLTELHRLSLLFNFLFKGMYMQMACFLWKIELEEEWDKLISTQISYWSIFSIIKSYLPSTKDKIWCIWNQ